MSIKYKLFLVIILACTVVVIGMFLLMQWSFDRGFLNYVNKTEISLFDKVHTKIETEYGKHGSWEFILQDTRLWHQLIFQALPERSNFGPPRNRPPPRERNNRAETKADFPLQPKEFHLRISLFDANKALLIGPQKIFENQTTKAIEYQGATIGYLSLEPRKELSNANELQFSEQQTDTFSLIALASFLIAGILAFPLANHFVRPIKILKQSTQVLASGHYKTRITKLTNDELGELSQDFNILAKTLEDNELARQQWIADISHELRTPLSILRGEIEAVIDGVRKSDGKAMQSLHQEVLQLTRLVDDLYELSLSDLGALNYRKCELDICELAESSIASFEAVFKQKNIELRLLLPSDQPLLLNGDRDRLQQLFTNLLKNSLRYTDNGGVSEVELLQGDNLLTLNFRDSSPGVSEADFAKLFDRLYRVESSRNRASGGAGLGMAMVKNIVEAHHGKVSALNSPYGGLWIAIEIPLQNV